MPLWGFNDVRFVSFFLVNWQMEHHRHTIFDVAAFAALYDHIGIQSHTIMAEHVVFIRRREFSTTTEIAGLHYVTAVMTLTG